MKKIFLLILSIVVQVYPQELFKIKESREVIAPAGNGLFYTAPKWSPVADKIAFSSNNFRGIWTYNLENDQLTQITDEISAGFGFSWSADGRMILARVSEYQQWKNFSAVKLFDLEQQKEILLTDYKPYLPSVPHWTPLHDKIYFFNGRQIEYVKTGYSIEGITWYRYCYSLSDKIIIENNTGEAPIELQPFPGVEYLNLVLSPNNQYLAFEVYGGNCFIMNLNTMELVDLGRGNYPQWSWDSQYLAYMLAEDDGHHYTASDIYISDLTGTVKQNITNDTDLITMYPTWSPSGLQIAFSTHNEGTIVLIELEK
jgi:Tol biopolymer transport system component